MTKPIGFECLSSFSIPSRLKTPKDEGGYYYSERAKNKMFKLIQKGMTIKDAAKKAGIHTKAAYRIHKEYRSGE